MKQIARGAAAARRRRAAIGRRGEAAARSNRPPREAAAGLLYIYPPNDMDDVHLLFPSAISRATLRQREAVEQRERPEKGGSVQDGGQRRLDGRSIHERRPRWCRRSLGQREMAEIASRTPTGWSVTCACERTDDHATCRTTFIDSRHLFLRWRVRCEARVRAWQG